MTGLLIMLFMGSGITAAVILFFYWLTYNALLGKKTQAENSFSRINTMLQKRYELMPDFVSPVKEYMPHEKDKLSAINEIRSKAMQDKLSDEGHLILDNQMSKAIEQIITASEACPELKANESFQTLQRNLNEIEEQLSSSRQAYNMAISHYNHAVDIFPSNLVAHVHNYPIKAFASIEI